MSLTQLYNEMTWQSLIYFYRLHNTDLQYYVAFKIKILLFLKLKSVLLFNKEMPLKFEK